MKNNKELKEFRLDNEGEDECSKCGMPNGVYVLKEQVQTQREKDFEDIITKIVVYHGSDIEKLLKEIRKIRERKR